MRLPEQLTIDDLITAFAEYEESTHRHESWVEYISYYKQQLMFMQQLFGCDLKKGKKDVDSRKELKSSDVEAGGRYEFNGRLTVRLFEDCIRLMNVTKTPFDYSGMMEGLPSKISRDLRKKYGDELNQHIEGLDGLYRAIAKEILTFMFPGIESKRIPSSKLYDRGLPKEEPDPVDFF